MKRKRIDFGISEPEKFVFGDDIVLYNRFTGKKLFTTKKTIDLIPSEEMKKLKKSEVNLDLSGIKKFRIELTFRCNCLCDYCLVYNNEIPKKGHSMNIETARNIIRKFNRDVRGGSIMVTGGEPLINWKVLDYIINNAEGDIQIFTNGTLINRKIAKELSKSNIKTFVSFDGWKELNFHRKYKNGKPNFEDTIKGYESLLSRGANTAVNCLITDNNVDYMEEIVKFFYENYGEKSFGLSIPHYTTINTFKVDFLNYISGMLNIFDYSKSKGIYIDQIGKRLKSIVDENFRYYSCKIAGEQITFYPDGTETLCTKLDTLDDFRDKDVSYLESKLPINSEDCVDCTAISICGGGCFLDSYFNDQGRDIRECLFNKALLNKILLDMVKYSPKNKVVDAGFFRKFYDPMLKK